MEMNWQRLVRWWTLLLKMWKTSRKIDNTNSLDGVFFSFFFSSRQLWTKETMCSFAFYKKGYLTKFKTVYGAWKNIILVFPQLLPALRFRPGMVSYGSSLTHAFSSYILELLIQLWNENTYPMHIHYTWSKHIGKTINFKQRTQKKNFWFDYF